MEDFITGLPKCELHVHVEGTLEAEMAAAVARRHGLEGADGLAARPPTFDGLSDFLADYYAAMRGLQDESDFYDLASAYLETAHRQGVVYAEIFFDPQAHTARGVPFDAVVSGIHRAQHDARRRGGPETELIMCMLRDESVESAEETLEASLPYRAQGWILGVGLDSDERGNPPTKFAKVFERARQEGYRITMHCDPRQDRSVENLWECLEVVDVERIDHGLECLADDALTAEIARRRLGLTACPLSNLALYGTLMAAEIVELMDRGVLVTINSDDPAYFGGYVADNYAAVQDDAHLSRAQMAVLARHGFEASWLAPGRKTAFLRLVDDYCAQAGVDAGA